MGLTKTKIGNLIQEYVLRNEDCKDIPFAGININKEFMPSHADTNEIDCSKYKLVSKNDFVFSGMQTGRDNCIRIAMYDKDQLIQVSPAYQTFKVTSENTLPRFLFMYFNSKEKDRYGAFLSDGSIRSNLDWDRFYNIEFDLPPIEIQRKYVAIYEGLLENLKVYESKLKDLKLVCDGYIEDLRKKYPLEPIFDKLTQRIEKNDRLTSKDMYGIGLNGIIPPNQERSDDSIKKCLKFYKGDLLYAPSSFKNGVIVYNDKIDVGVITEEYRVFYVSKGGLNPQYLLMWLKRSELGRYIDFYTMDSVRNRFQFEELNIVEIPIPPIEFQNSIVEVFNVYNERKEYVTRLKNIIKDICPILVRGAIKEASEVK